MSGKKTITVDRDVYNRTREQASRALSAERSARSAEEKARAEKAKNDRLMRDLAAQDRYHGELKKRMDVMGSQLADAKQTASETKKQLLATIDSTNRALATQQDSFRKALADTRNDLAKTIDKNNKAIENVIDKNNKAIKAEINQLRNETDIKLQQLRTELGNTDDVIGTANDNIQVSEELLKKVNDLRDDMLLPGRKARVVDAINKAKNAVIAATDANGALADAALSGVALTRAQDAFKEAHDFYRDLIAAENEWASKLSATLQALSAAEQEIEETKVISIDDLVDENGNLVGTIRHDTDHWSNGGLTALNGTVGALRNILNSDSSRDVSIDELDDITKQAQLIADEAHDIMSDSFCAVTLSSKRVRILKSIGTELAEKCGLTTGIQAGFEGRDSRAASILHVKNDATGFEACIILSNDFSKGIPEVTAETTIINPGNTQAAAERFDENLSAIMKAHGFDSDGSPIPVNESKANEVADWKKKDKKDVKTVQTITPCDEALNTSVKRQQSNRHTAAN